MYRYRERGSRHDDITVAMTNMKRLMVMITVAMVRVMLLMMMLTVMVVKMKGLMGMAWRR